MQVKINFHISQLKHNVVGTQKNRLFKHKKQMFKLIDKKSLELWREISNNVVCTTSKGSDQPVHTRSLIRAFASRLNIK